MSDEQEKVNPDLKDQTNPTNEQPAGTEKKNEVEEVKQETTLEEAPVSTKVEDTPLEETQLEKSEPVVEEPKVEAVEEVKEGAPETVKETVTETVAEEAPVNEKPAEEAEPEKPAPVKAEIPVEPEEFDWDSVGKKPEIYSKAEREKLEDLYNKTFNSIAEHEVVEGNIVGLNDREAVVNINFKSDGVIPRAELRYNTDLKIGDTIEVYVESQEDNTGQLLLSHKKARILKSWERVNEAFEKEEVINGYVKSRTKGGLIVDIFGIEAFLPGSQIDVKPIRDYDVFVDKVMEFKVVKINHEYKNVVVSHKALIERELEQQRAEIISKLEKGQVLEGTVKNITTYGVFVDLGGVDGLVHITDLSWGRINHPDEIVELDQKIKVAILDFDENKKRIALGLKQLTPHPWDALDANLKIGDKLNGKVVVLADYGAFVEIAPGVEGLIHVSEMSWSQHLRTAQDFLNVGDELEAVILTLDREERKMSLGMKQLIPDPWKDIKDRYPVGSKHTATVRNFTNFGIFVELEEGVDGLIHISDLSWSKKIKHPAEFTKIGEKIEVVVLDVDEENRRLSLGHKQLEENPWDVFESVFTVGSIHKGIVANSNDKGMVVTLPYGVEGFAPTRHLQKEDGSMVRVDDAIEFKIIEFSKENKKIILSHSRIYQDSQYADKVKEDKEHKAAQRTTKQAVKKMKDNLEKTTFGDIGGLAQLKSDMEQEARQKLEVFAKKQEEKEQKGKVKAKKTVEKKDATKTAELKAEVKKEVVKEAKEEVTAEKKDAETPVEKKPAKKEEPKAEAKKEEEVKEEAKEDDKKKDK
ncbi:MAG: 30S ribosomal protein S1 [Bacteroidetes bacterium 4484_276]|nr:MAG: 30S ribosomal protein S1 [Bacteroidetes bacterium 4484_276]